MECRDIRKKIYETVENGGFIDKNAALSRHVAECDLCRRYYSDLILDRRLGRTLRNMPAPEPAPGFAADIVEYAVHTHRLKRRRVFAAGVSAAALLMVAVGVSLMTFFVNPGAAVISVVMPVGGEKTVHIVIEAVAPRSAATLDIALAGDVAVRGYPGQERLQWQTDIQQGKNVLAIPILLRDRPGGNVNVRYAYDGTETAVSIQVLSEANGVEQT
ncbi:MAG: hypothetical protein SWH68_01080 [Thermodesulfobacteriota bacterium]|nr:hypothetical protein [Thermodesulfobacteriota bacterium]